MERVREIDRQLGAATPDAFLAFVHAQTTALLRLARLITHNQPDAEDLVQDTLLQAHRKWPLVNAALDPPAYVRKMLVNLYLQNARKGSPTIRVVDHAEPSNPDSTTAVEDRDYLRQALAGLPPRQRTALVLRYYLDLDDLEISRLIGCRRPTVRSHVRRGIKTLQRAEDPTGEAL